VPTVLASYHDLPFTAHQGVGRTVEFIKKKYWWETLVFDVRNIFGKVKLVLKGREVIRLLHPWVISWKPKNF
jgi:hypothetical protein